MLIAGEGNSKLSTDALLERLTVFLVSASLAGVVLAVLGFFFAPVVLALAVLCTWIYHLRVSAASSRRQPHRRCCTSSRCC